MTLFSLFLGQDDIVLEESSHYQVLAAIYTPVYMNLMDVLLQKSQYPSDDEFDSWDEGKHLSSGFLAVVSKRTWITCQGLSCEHFEF